ncbi:MAG: hypothetical protein AAFV88_19560 [Planctomycetota bacterium]
MMPGEVVSVFICEQGTRWRDAVRRFWGPFQHLPGPIELDPQGSSTHSATSRSFQTVSLDRPKLLAAIATQRESCVVIWEDHAGSVRDLLAAIRQVKKLGPVAIQCVAHPRSLDAAARRRVSAYQELGVEVLIDAPERLPQLKRLVNRSMDRI